MKGGAFTFLYLQCIAPLKINQQKFSAFDDFSKQLKKAKDDFLLTFLLFILTKSFYAF